MNGDKTVFLEMNIPLLWYESRINFESWHMNTHKLQRKTPSKVNTLQKKQNSYFLLVIIYSSHNLVTTIIQQTYPYWKIIQLTCIEILYFNKISLILESFNPPCNVEHGSNLTGDSRVFCQIPHRLHDMVLWLMFILQLKLSTQKLICDHLVKLVPQHCFNNNNKNSPPTDYC